LGNDLIAKFTRWMLRQYYEYFYNNATRQFWRIPEPPAINHEMDGTVVVITDSSSGLGLATVKQIFDPSDTTHAH